MGETVYVDVFGDEIILTDDTQTRNLNKHPEIAPFLDRIVATLQDPDEVRRSTVDDRQVIYYRFESEVLNGKYVVVIVKHADRNFVSTIYASHRLKKGEILWSKK